MNKQGQQEQEIFLLQTHAGVGQDKATPPRMHAASDQPSNATAPAYRDIATPPKKHHGSQKRQLREVAGCVPQQTFDEIERMRVQWGKHGKKLSRSQVVGTLVKQGVQKNVDIKYGSMWLCTKSPVINMTHRSLRAFWPHFDGFSRPHRPIFFIKIRLRDDFWCKAGRC